MKITIEDGKITIEDDISLDFEKEESQDVGMNGLISALHSMKEAYVLTWKDRHNIKFGRGSYKIRQLFREAEKAGLL